MTVQKTHEKLLKMYLENPSPTLYMSGKYRTSEEDLFNTEKVSIDIERHNRRIAIAVSDLTSGPRMNETTKFTTKEFKPPMFNEGFPIQAMDLFDRNPNVDPFKDPKFIATATARAFKEFRLQEDAIRRTIELQASQIATTGTVTLKNEDGVDVYTLDYKAKTAHFPTAINAWDTASATIRADLLSLFDVIHKNGKAPVKRIDVGDTSWEAMIADDDFNKLLDLKDLDVAKLTGLRNPGEDMGKLMGILSIGPWKVEVWTYPGTYEDPQNPGTELKYLPGNKVVAYTDKLDFRLVYGACPVLARPDQRVLRYIPSQISSAGAGLQMYPFAWLTRDASGLVGSVKSRPLCIPTSIDRFGALNTGTAA
jgi:hypothetical protein